VSKLGLVIAELHRAENDLALQLLRMSERHHADHEIYHVGHDLARWSQQHVRELAAAGRRCGVDLSADLDEESSVLKAVREKGSDLVGRRPEPGMLLLRDLRELYCAASGVSVDWELLAQGAQAAKDEDLIDLAARCHPQTLRQVRWVNAMVKEAAPQALVG
jgi:hypothetical protein